MAAPDDPKSATPHEDAKPANPPVAASDFISDLVESSDRQRDAEKQKTDKVSKDRSTFAAAAALTEPAKLRTIACMVTHGMGQQVPFETAATIGEAFVRGRKPDTVQANRVRLTEDADLLSRLELVYAADAENPETHVHIYEGYWAPLTEGKISYAQALGFLFSGAVAGSRSAITSKKFDRWIFNRMCVFGIKKHTLTILFTVVLILLVGLLLAAIGASEITHVYNSLRHLTNTPFTQLPKVVIEMLIGHWMRILLMLVLVGLAFGYRYLLNLFIIEYLGDVAIYVSSYKVSGFQEIRDAIQKTVFNVGKQIFQAKKPEHDPDAGKPVYDGVIFVGHSLGSVITYDLINALIVWDTKGCDGEHNVVGRIHRFITFGSPLDKTAFLFRNQTSEDHHYREGLAGLMQALVLDYALRPFPWVNLYSKKDIVSGNLQYYDTPSMDVRPVGYNPVQNAIDPAARTPILAHTQYWNGMALSRELLAGLTPPD
ncbi:MAG: hypothetical protein M3O31_00350 [Acidobacteriota bacterium]|nr:hypothetical protein [Acidobacteriota bacterium]